MPTGNSVSYGLSSAQTELYKKTNTDVMTAFKDFTEEYGWADDTPDIRITASANEMRLVIDVNKEVGVANIAEGGYEAIASSVSAENGTLSPIQMNARFSFSTLYKKGWDGSGAKGGQIENEVRFKALKKTQALARVFGQQFYGYSTGYLAVVKTTQGASATQTDLPLKDPFNDTDIDDTSANGLAYLSLLFPAGERVALVRSAAIIEIGVVNGAGSSGDGFIDVTFNASCTPTAGDQLVLANAVTDATLAGTSYNKAPVGFLDATKSASVHGIATSSVPGWASYQDTTGGRWSVAKQKKMAQKIMNLGGVKADRMIISQGVERDILAGESAARRYAPSDAYDLDGTFKAKGVKIMSSELVPPGLVGMWNNKAFTKKFFNDLPPEQGGPDLFDTDKVQDRGLVQASLDFIMLRAVTNRGGMAVATGLTEQ